MNYPGAGLRFFFSDQLAAEGRMQYQDNIIDGGARLYAYPKPYGTVYPFYGIEADYTTFKGGGTTGTGYAGGAFAGIESFLSKALSVQVDAGAAYVFLKDTGTSLTSNDFTFVFNVGLNFYYRRGQQWQK